METEQKEFNLEKIKSEMDRDIEEIKFHVLRLIKEKNPGRYLEFKNKFYENK